MTVHYWLLCYSKTNKTKNTQKIMAPRIKNCEMYKALICHSKSLTDVFTYDMFQFCQEYWWMSECQSIRIVNETKLKRVTFLDNCDLHPHQSRFGVSVIPIWNHEIQILIGMERYVYRIKDVQAHKNVQKFTMLTAMLRNSIMKITWNTAFKHKEMITFTRLWT